MEPCQRNRTEGHSKYASGQLKLTETSPLRYLLLESRIGTCLFPHPEEENQSLQYRGVYGN